ncbi:MAG: hypothetical protein ACKO0Z_06870 [Betaproteobacteria bacterium]
MMDLRDAVKKADAILAEVEKWHGKLSGDVRAAFKVRICKMLRDVTREPSTVAVDQLRAQDDTIRGLEHELTTLRLRFKAAREFLDDPFDLPTA